MKKALRIGIVVGEKSGDILGAGLIQALQKLSPEIEFVGIAGPAMQALGSQSFAPMERLSVMGFVEPLGRLPELLSIKKKVQDYFLREPPAVFIGIDAPDFNLRIETVLRKAGIKTVHYVSPSVWAYRAKRIHKIKLAVDLMLTLFPFETSIYRQHGIAVKCVGHPLADTIGFQDRKLEQRRHLQLADDARVVALMPGSRSGEVKRLGPIFIAAAVESLQHQPRLQFIIPCSSPDTRLQISSQLQQLGIFSGEQFQLVDDSHAAISAADLVVLASGTATLETLLLRRPMIVCYKLAALTYAIASRMVKIPFIALPNLLAGEQLVPEYVQQRVTVPKVRDEIVQFMHDLDNNAAENAVLLKRFDEIHRVLRRDASAQAAAAIWQLISTKETA